MQQKQKPLEGERLTQRKINQEKSTQIAYRVLNKGMKSQGVSNTLCRKPDMTIRKTNVK